MYIRISKEKTKEYSVNRDGIRNDSGREGFHLCMGDLTLHFEDEQDIENIAKKILYRLGWDFNEEESYATK